MTKSNRHRLIQAVLLLALVYGLVSTVADGARSLSVKTVDSRIIRVEVVQAEVVVAVVEFSSVPNTHTFHLPKGEYVLRGMSDEAVLYTKSVYLDEDKQLRF